MKKVLFIVVAVVFLLSACEPKKEGYTSEQNNALKKLKGNYHAYVNNEMIYAVISFTANYITPHAISDEKTFLFDAHGECYFSDYKYPIPDKGYITCYYVYSKDATTMSFYYMSGDNDKNFLRYYNLHIQSDDEFTLMDERRILKFEKVK